MLLFAFTRTKASNLLSAIHWRGREWQTKCLLSTIKIIELSWNLTISCKYDEHLLVYSSFADNIACQNVTEIWRLYRILMIFSFIDHCQSARLNVLVSNATRFSYHSPPKLLFCILFPFIIKSICIPSPHACCSKKTLTLMVLSYILIKETKYILEKRCSSFMNGSSSQFRVMARW